MGQTRKEIKDVKIEKIALTLHPANHEKQILMKSEEAIIIEKDKVKNMEIENNMKAEELEALKKSETEAKEQIEVLKKSEAETKAKLEELMKSEEAAKTELVKLQKAEQDRVILAKAESFKDLPVSTDDLVALFNEVKSEKLEKIFDACQVALKKTVLMTEVAGGMAGTSQSQIVPKTANDKIEMEVERLMKSDAKLNKTQAMVDLISKHPELYDEYLNSEETK